MEKLYYILDTEINEIVLDNLTHDECMQWLIENGIASKHVMFEKTEEH